MNLPTQQECLDYFKQYKVPKNILGHCLSVQKVAIFLAEKLKLAGREIDPELAGKIALLHDLFKVVALKDLNPTKYHHYDFSEEEIAMWKQLREKYASYHEGEVAYLVFKEKYRFLALSLKSYGAKEQTGKTPEEALVHYVDLRILKEEIVPLTQRLAYLREVYPRSKGFWDEAYAYLKDYEEEIFSHLSFTPDQLKEKIKVNS